MKKLDGKEDLARVVKEECLRSPLGQSHQLNELLNHLLDPRKDLKDAPDNELYGWCRALIAGGMPFSTFEATGILCEVVFFALYVFTVLSFCCLSLSNVCMCKMISMHMWELIFVYKMGSAQHDLNSGGFGWFNPARCSWEFKTEEQRKPDIYNSDWTNWWHKKEALLSLDYGYVNILTDA